MEQRLVRYINGYCLDQCVGCDCLRSTVYQQLNECTLYVMNEYVDETPYSLNSYSCYVLTSFALLKVMKIYKICHFSVER